jgi:hypothetical protein
MEEGMKGIYLGDAAKQAIAKPPDASTTTAAATATQTAQTKPTFKERLRQKATNAKGVFNLRAARQKEEFISFVGKLGRVGYATKGIVYGTIAVIAIYSAIVGGTSASAENASLFSILAGGWFGIFVLVALMVGMLCYSTWRIFEGAFLLRVRRDAPPLRKFVSGRVVPFASATFYIIYAVSLVLIIIDAGGTTGISTALASSVGGQVILVIGGLILFGVAVEQIVGVCRRKFERDMNRKALEKNKHARRAVFGCASIGITGRARLFALLGVLCLRLAFDPSLTTASAKSGFSEAIGQFQTSIYGMIILIIVALGLLVFMLFCFLQVRYKEFLNEGEGFDSRRSTNKNKPILPTTTTNTAATKQPLSLPPPQPESQPVSQSA